MLEYFAAESFAICVSGSMFWDMIEYESPISNVQAAQCSQSPATDHLEHPVDNLLVVGVHWGC